MIRKGIWSRGAMLASLILICFLYIVHLIYVPRSDFIVAHHTPLGLLQTKWFAFLSLGAYILFVGILFFLKNISWKKIVSIILISFSVIAILAVATYPTRSQDIYWSLMLVDGYTEKNLNPYTTTPDMLKSTAGEWGRPVSYWGDFSMIYGPLWVLLLIPITYLSSLATVLIFIKSISLAALVVSFWILWKILDIHNFAYERKVQILGVVMLNPFIIQTVLIDAHNDIFILLSLLLSYYFLQTSRYSISMIVLSLGGLVKYVPWLLLPIPVWYIWKYSGVSKMQRIKKIFLTLFVIAIFSLIAWSPFVRSFSDISGIVRGVGVGNIPWFSGPGAVLIQDLFQITDAVYIKLFGILLAVGALIIGLRYKKILFAYTVPYILLFIFTAWFVPWYFLWIFLICALYMPTSFLILLTIVLTLTPDFLPSGYLIAPFAVYGLYLVMKNSLFVRDEGETITLGNENIGNTK